MYFYTLWFITKTFKKNSESKRIFADKQVSKSYFIKAKIQDWQCFPKVIINENLFNYTLYTFITKYNVSSIYSVVSEKLR